MKLILDEIIPVTENEVIAAKPISFYKTILARLSVYIFS